MWETKFSFCEQYLSGFLFSRNAKEAHTNQIILTNFFYSVWKEVPHKLLKVTAARKYFSSVYIIDTTSFGECFLFHVITGRHYFLYKFIVTQKFGTSAMLLHSLRHVSWKKSAFYICCLPNNITMLLIRKVQNKASTSKLFSTKLTIIDEKLS